MSHTDLVWTVVFLRRNISIHLGESSQTAATYLVRLAVAANQISRNLGTHAHAVANFDRLHVLADFDGFTNNLYISSVPGLLEKELSTDRVPHR